MQNLVTLGTVYIYIYIYIYIDNFTKQRRKNKFNK